MKSRHIASFARPTFAGRFFFHIAPAADSQRLQTNRFGPSAGSILGVFLLAAVSSICSIAQAQTASASEPDYSQVNDFLDGRRTLLAINDLTIGGLVLPTSDGTKIDDKNIYRLPGYDPKNAGPEVSARILNSPNDTLVYTNGDTIFMQDPVTKTVVSFQWAGQDLRSALMAACDFRGDGLNEVVIATAGGTRIVAPRDPNNLSNGIFAGDVWQQSSRFANPKPAALVVGDIRGFGNHYVVTAHMEDYRPLVERRPVLIYNEIDPKLLRANGAGGYKLLSEFGKLPPDLKASLAAGRFGTTLRDQVAVAYYSTNADGTNPSRVKIEAFDLEKNITSTRILDRWGGEIVLKAARFDPNSPNDQVAMKWDLGRDNVRLGIVTFDSALNIRLPGFTVAPVACSTPGLAVGNFSRTEPIPQDPSKTQLSFKLQLAIETDTCGASRHIGLNIFNVDPPSSLGGEFKLERTQAYTKTTDQPPWIAT